APLYRDSLAGERGGKGAGRVQVRVGSATLSTRAFRPNATVPSARMQHPSIPPGPPPPPPPVLPIPPPLRKKLSPTVELESEGTVRARFSNVISPRSGDQVIAGGASTTGPGSMRKSTLLS